MKNSSAGASVTGENAAEIVLVAPFPVSTNAYWRNVRGRTLISAAGRAYAASLARECRKSLPTRPLTGRIKVTCKLHEPDRSRRRDLDNFCGKALLDAITKAKVWGDDSQVDDQRNTRGAVWPDSPCCIVTIRELTPDESKELQA